MSAEDDKPDSQEIEIRVRAFEHELNVADLPRRRDAAKSIYDLCYAVGIRAAAAAIPALVRCLGDADDQIGESGAWGLVYCAPLSIEPLVECLRATDAGTKIRACSAIGNIGDATSPAHFALRTLLNDPIPNVRLRAAWAIGLAHDTAPLTIDALFLMASSALPAERSAALHALGNLGQVLVDSRPLQARKPQILEWLLDESEDVRWAASFVLESLKLPAAEHAALLAKTLRFEKASRVRSMLVGQMKQLTAAGDLERYVPLMCEVIIEGGREAAEMCEVVATLGPRARAAVPAILIALNGEGFLALNAAKALWAIDRRVEESLPVLERLFHDYGETVCDVICELGSAAAALIPSVIEALESENWDLQWAAADALGAVASDAPEVLTALENALGHPSPVVKAAAARALGQLGATAVPGLVKILRDMTDGRSEWAADALGRMKHQAADASDDLRRALRDRRPTVTHWAAVAIAKVTGDLIALPILVRLLKDSDAPNMRREAATGLAALGPPAIDALPALDDALADDDPDVQAAAEEAIAAIHARTN